MLLIITTQKMSSTAIPRSLNLGTSKPTTIPAYSRRVESIATNAQNFQENGIANIVLDTSTPGSFLDPTQSLLQFDIAITNTNPYIDYINFSAGGISSIIQEMRIICQGTPIEEMLDYNLMFEMFMDLGGHAQEEFKMYMENGWRAPVLPGQSDLNFVKPPMVDREGVIMCPTMVNMLGDGAANHYDDGTYKTQSILSKRTAFTNKGDAVSAAASVYGTAMNTGVHNQTLNGPSATAASGFSYTHPYSVLDPRPMSSTAPGTIRTQAFTNRLDNTYVTWPSTIRPEPLWKNEARMRQEADSRKYRVQDYLNYLTNVKNIPVGIAPGKSFIKTDSAFVKQGLVNTGESGIANWDFSSLSAHLSGKTASTTTNFSVSLPIFSGILGVWAEKQFPTMLISPGSFYIQIKFAKAQQAFQCAMDPCRRIFGTYRDYVCNNGLPSYYATEYNGQVLNDDGYSTQAASVNTVSADGKSITPGTTCWFAYTTAGTLGIDFAWEGSKPAWLTGTLALTAATPGVLSQSPEGTCTGNPKPQYLPRKNPFVLGGTSFFAKETLAANVNNVSVAVCRERQSCFGTYLPCSTAQVRRTRNGDNTSVADALNIPSDTYPTFNVTNLRYVGMQTILPDEVTASIVRSAASSDISLHAQSVRTYRTIMSQSNNQSLILPIKVASANSLWVIFQNQSMIENTHYLSTTRTCPFSSYQFTPGTTTYFVGSDTAPKISPVATLNPFSIQLRIGNELVPQQPITSIPQVVTELMRSIHGLGDMNSSLQFTNTLRINRGKDNTTVIDGTTAPTEYNFFKSGDFTTPFIPVVALDDQTITNNNLFQDYLTDGSAYTTFNDRGIYVLNEFLPPVSKFLLGFDLDTFPNTNDTARSGRYLGNAPLTLQMTNCVACSTSSVLANNQDSIIATAVVLHDIRFSIMAGGQVLAYY